MDGLELARHLHGLTHAAGGDIRHRDDKHAVEAFEVNALDYLLKPVRGKRLARRAEEGRARRRADRDRLAQAVRVRGATVSVAERAS